MADINPATSGTALSPALSEGLARMLRHEVGDFLQKVYATVAILQERLPAESAMERETLMRLRKRAEGCRSLLDAVQDFLCSMTAASEPVDLAQVTRALAASGPERYPRMEIIAESDGKAQLHGDPERLAQLGQLLLANACEAGGSRVILRTSAVAGSATVAWTFSDNGPGIPQELSERMFTPFVTSRAGHAGLGLALAQKITLVHRGTITARNNSAGGCQVTVVLPVAEL